MGEIGKIVRWVAPGAVFSLLALISVLVTRIIWGFGNFSVVLISFSGEMTAGVVALAIPVGFLIYQDYYRGYLRVGPLSLLVPYVRAMPPSSLLKSAMSKEWAADGWEAALAGELRVDRCSVFGLPRVRRLALVDAQGRALRGKVRRERTEVYQGRRRTALSRLDQALTSKCHGEKLDVPRARIERLAEIYHTLGAGRRACFWAWICGFGWALATRWQWTTNQLSWGDTPRSVLALLTSGAICAYVASILHMNRSDTKERLDVIYSVVLS